MIVYDTKKWGATLLKILISFRRANNYRRLLLFILFSSAYCGIVIYINSNFVEKKLQLDPVVFSLIAIILSLILVFRLNSAYGKWWEARQHWGDLVNNCRTLSAYVNSYLDNDDKERRYNFASNISNFCLALKGHLRNNVDFSEFDINDPKLKEKLKQKTHVPHAISAQLFDNIAELKDTDKMTEVEAINAKRNVEKLIDILGACERIKNTPIPFSHSSFIKVSLLVYIFILPFGLMGSFGYLAVAVTAVMTFALVGVEIISEEIEEPFGTDPNDLPLTFLCNTIRTNVYDILDVEIPTHLKKDGVLEYKNYSVRT